LAGEYDVGDTNKNVEIAIGLAEGIKAGDMDANGSSERSGSPSRRLGIGAMFN